MKVITSSTSIAYLYKNYLELLVITTALPYNLKLGYTIPSTNHDIGILMLTRPIFERIDTFLIAFPRAKRILIHPDDMPTVLNSKEVEFTNKATLYKGLPIKELGA